MTILNLYTQVIHRPEFDMVDDRPSHNLSELAGKKIAIDISIELHRVLIDPRAVRQFHASPEVAVTQAAKLIISCHKNLHKKNDITAVHVFDGLHNPLKKQTDDN